MSITNSARAAVRLSALCGAVLALAAGCGPQKPPHAGQRTPQADAMVRMLADVDQLRAYTDGKATKPQAEAAVSDLESWVPHIAALFPPGEAPRLYVDMTPEMARDAPAAMEATVGPLSAAVRSGNRASVAAALDRTEQQGCGACHQKPYR